MEKIKLLLNQVRVINDKYKEIAIAKGENFNLFDIMGMRTDEVKTHSAIIAELLNPKGSHDMGAVFLKLFLQKLITINTQPNDKEKHEYLLNCNLLNTKIFIERDIGQISEDQTVGGRIDILLSNDEFEICIENKIYAGDQPFKLRRYHNHLTKKNKTENKKTLLIYLTLDGKSASEESTCISKNNEGIWLKDESEVLEVNKDYFCISYQTEVLSWLEECHSLAADKPILRESLKQFILLIRSLTNQATNNVMENELHQIILTDIESAENISNKFGDVLKVETEKFRDAVIEALNTNKGLEIIDLKVNNFLNIKGIFVKVDKSPLWIGIESFSGYGHNIDPEKKDKIEEKEKGTLFIGVVDFNSNSDLSKTKGIWVKDSIERIWSRKEYLYEKLQHFVKGNESEVVNELVQKIIDFKKRKFEIAK